MDFEHIPKVGDIKVDTFDLCNLLQGYEIFQNIVFNNLDILNDEEKTSVQNSYDTYLLFYNKYITISHLRRVEHLWFLVLKKIDNNDFEKVDKDNLQASEDNDLSIYLDCVKNMIKNEQDIPKNIGTLLGLTIAVFGTDVVRREVWGNYLEIKSERESLIRKLISD